MEPTSPMPLASSSGPELRGLKKCSRTLSEYSHMVLSLNRERRAAGTLGAGVRVVELEPGVGQRIDEIDGHVIDHRHGHRIDQQLDAIDLDFPVVVGLFGLQLHAVLQA